MFSGIVESMARVIAIEHEQDNVHLTLTCPFVEELNIDQSIAHNGVCLTVVRLEAGTYTVTAMRETLERSNLGLLKVGDEVNVERSMMMNGRLDGHIVQGHVDQTAVCIGVEDQQGSHQYTFKYESSKEIVCRPTEDTFQVCIIPYTFDNTNFHAIKPGTVVNIEFDIIGKYLARMQSLL